MSVDNALDNGKSDPRPFKLFGAMESLKDTK
jgi:hypothetical protein